MFIQTLERGLVEHPGRGFPHEVLNALLKLADYPRPYILDFKPGVYPDDLCQNLIAKCHLKLQSIAVRQSARVIDMFPNARMWVRRKS